MENFFTAFVMNFSGNIDLVYELNPGVWTLGLNYFARTLYCMYFHFNVKAHLYHLHYEPLVVHLEFLVYFNPYRKCFHVSFVLIT